MDLAAQARPTPDVASRGRAANASAAGVSVSMRPPTSSPLKRPPSASSLDPASALLPGNREPRNPRAAAAAASAASPAGAVPWGGQRGPEAPPQDGHGGARASRSQRSNVDMESLVDALGGCALREDEDAGSMRRVSYDESLPKKAVETPICHTIKIIQNIPFLYQEYRDTSEQKEIEQRRQLDTLQSAEEGKTGGGVVTPPALQLQLRNDTQSLSLWQNLDVVRQSGLLESLPQKEIIMQEAMFELVTSEASYYKSLELLETHFLKNPVLVNTLNQSDMHFIFSNIEEVMKASERFLMDLENRVEQSIQISDVCDIVYEHAVEHFHVFISYVINQGYQEKNYRRILQGNMAFRETMAKLENQPKVRGLSFTSFLILPFQRITRLKLLVQNILKKAEENSERESNAIKAHEELERIVRECNEGVRKMNRTEELISIEKTLEFKSKSVPVISHSRWLLKKGEVQQMNGPKSTRTMRSRKLYQPLYLFLFNNLLLITKRSSSGEKFQVLDSCTRAMLRTEDMDDQGQMLANVFTLHLLENQEERPVTYLLKATSVSDKLRWMCALTPNRRTRFLSTSAHQSDSPQVQCIQSYSSQEPDELSIEMADVLNVLERTDDGWMMGERLHDGEKGWFPTRVVEEIQNQELRAQNLRECQRIQQAKGGATGRSVASSRGRGPSKVTNAEWLRIQQSEKD
ncbi:ephexin-1 isoform X2 [Scleropages formosus]|uniref:Neuronal guanine nucleotide exchange factor n=1 Tax=Scleropages formosus TaxID=113540 RepID=A0A8C9W0X5_SCLFO|nr:ephexin-1 isoform X2 [Scleropages formosus]